MKSEARTTIYWPKGMYGCPQAMIEAAPVLDLLERTSRLIGELLEHLPDGGPRGVELLSLLMKANDIANDRDALLVSAGRLSEEEGKGQ